MLAAALRDREVAKLPSIRREQRTGDPVRWIKGQLRVTFPGDAEIMEVSLTAENPEEAATLVKAVVDAYLHEFVNTDVDRRRLRLAELDRAVSEKEQDIRARREELKKLATELGTSTTENLTLRQKLVLEELSLYRQELRKMQTDLRVATGRLAVQKTSLTADIEEIDASDPAVESVARTDPIAREVFMELGWLRADKLHSQHPDSAAGEKAIKALQKSYDARLAELVPVVRQKMRAKREAEIRRTEAEIAVQKEQLKDLETQTQRKQQEAEKFGNSTVDMEMLLADIKNADYVLNLLASERDRLRVENRAAPRVILLQPAVKPETPDN